MTLVPRKRPAWLHGHALEQLEAARLHVLGVVPTSQVSDAIDAAGPVNDGDDRRLPLHSGDQVTFEVTDFTVRIGDLQSKVDQAEVSQGKNLALSPHHNNADMLGRHSAERGASFMATVESDLKAPPISYRRKL